MDAGDDEEVRSGKFLEYVVDARRKLEALLVLRHGSRMPTRLRDGERLLDDEEKRPPIPEPPAAGVSTRQRRKLKI
jgi:hypothetical protein